MNNQKQPGESLLIKKISIGWGLLFAIVTTSIAPAQDNMSSDWIDVSGQSEKSIKKIIQRETDKIDIYSDKVIGKAAKAIEDENSKRTENFNSKKLDLRIILNKAVDEKNILTLSVNDLKDKIAFQKANINTFKGNIANADSSIANSQRLIQEERSRVLTELTNIPFYEVLIGKVENFPPDQNPLPYDNALATSISRRAIESQLGLSIISENIVEDGVIEKERVKTLLKGKANANLERYEEQVEDTNGKAYYNLYRFGLVAVYPFQESEIDLSEKDNSGIEVTVDIIESVSDPKVQHFKQNLTAKIRNMLAEKSHKNSNSESQVRRLTLIANQVISREQQKIEASELVITQNESLINSAMPEIEADEYKLQGMQEQLNLAMEHFQVAQNKYNNHIANEQHVRVFTGVHQAAVNEDKASRFAEIAAGTYDEFIASIKSEYLKEESEVSGDSYTEIKESRKANVKLNGVKIVGKFSKQDYGKISLITYVAYNFGFEFEEVLNTPSNQTSGSDIAHVNSMLTDKEKGWFKKLKTNTPKPGSDAIAEEDQPTIESTNTLQDVPWTPLQFGLVERLRLGDQISSVFGLRLAITPKKNLDVVGIDVGIWSQVERDLRGLAVKVINTANHDISGTNISLYTHAGNDIDVINIGGLGLVADGSLLGISVGGLGIMSREYTAGVSVGGLASYTEGSAYGINLGGLSTITKEDLIGIQHGTLFNQVDGDGLGFQFGLVNTATNFYGIQGLYLLPALYNRVDISAVGIMYGLVNISEYIGGLQVGLYNRTEDLQGLQIGLWNVNNSGFNLPIINFGW